MITWNVYLQARILATSIWSEKLVFLEIFNIQLRLDDFTANDLYT